MSMESSNDQESSAHRHAPMRTLSADEASMAGVSKGTARQFLQKFKKFAVKHGLDPSDTGYLKEQRRAWQHAPESSSLSSAGGAL